ncbi:DUF6247 family protein [Nocardia sp. NPDC023852]|uniref:DUF6247 family protein n=1 Tax=Nocardia sp. NPDC023852 TaxID=3154697 RepID=UPI0033D44B32
MATPSPLPEPVMGVPAAEPAAIRAALTRTMLAEFDREWEIVLDQAKNSKELSGVLELLTKWRHIAATEAREPGAYFRLQAKAEQIQRAGANLGAGSIEDMRALIARRQAS